METSTVLCGRSLSDDNLLIKSVVSLQIQVVVYIFSDLARMASY